MGLCHVEMRVGLRRVFPGGLGGLAVLACLGGGSFSGLVGFLSLSLSNFSGSLRGLSFGLGNFGSLLSCFSSGCSISSLLQQLVPLRQVGVRLLGLQQRFINGNPRLPLLGQGEQP